MDLVVTLVAPGPLDPARVAAIVGALRATRAERLAPQAADVYAAGDPAAVRAAIAPLGEGLDVIVQPVATRGKRLLVSDMDSTLIGQECIDELAGAHGLKPRVAAITERAMRGELDFAAALRERVALLQGIPVAAIGELLAGTIRPTPGAATLAATCRAEGIRTVLVSGGFTAFAEPVARGLGMDAAFANRLDTRDGRLTGTVAEPILGADAKREILQAECRRLGLGPDAAVALGDGANDGPMVVEAGLGLGWRPKPALAAVADAVIVHTDLTAALFALGIPVDRFVEKPDGIPFGAAADGGAPAEAGGRG